VGPAGWGASDAFGWTSNVLRGKAVHGFPGNVAQQSNVRVTLFPPREKASNDAIANRESLHVFAYFNNLSGTIR
jgi:hypothetical protein